MRQDGASITVADAAAASTDTKQHGVVVNLVNHHPSSMPESTNTTHDKSNPGAMVVPLLHSLTSKDNSARNLAEQAFNDLKDSHPEALVYGLLEALGSPCLAIHVRVLSAVLLRRALLVEEPSLWDCLPPDASEDEVNGPTVGGFGGGQRELQACLLRILSDERDVSVRRKVGDLVGELGRAVLDEEGPEGWPEFLPYVLLSASSHSEAVPAVAAAAGMPTADPQQRHTTTSTTNPLFNLTTPTKGSNRLSGASPQQASIGTATCTPAHIATVTPTNTIASPQGQRTTDADATWGRGRVVTGLRLLSAAAEHAANAAAADHNAFRALVETLQRCLCCDGGVGLGDGCSEADVRLEAVRALGSVVVSCPRPSDQEALGSCLSHLLQAIQGTLSSPDQCSSSGVWYCCETLELVIELAEACPSFLRPRVAQCVRGMVQVAGDQLVDTSVRHLALEFLVTIVEASPAMCRKMGHASPGDGRTDAGGGGQEQVAAGNGGDAVGQNAFAAMVIPVCFAMMTELPENASWAQAETEEEDSVEDNVCEVGSEALERVAQALGSRAALPECRRLIKEGLSGWNWQQQHAAMTAVGNLADVYNKQQGDKGYEIREEALLQLLPFVGCNLPRVQHAALMSLERMAEDQSPELQEEHHETVLPVLLTCFHFQPGNAGVIGSCPRVTHRALLALAQMVEACPEGAVAPHADVMIQRCVGLVRQGPLMVQEASVALLSTTADAMEDDFGRFYDDVMPILTQVLSSCQGQEQRLLRGKTLECVSLVGSTVGKERFGVDALSVMQLMVQAQASGLDADDPTRVYMLRAWVRICKCLGPDFVPYLPLVMPPLLAAASANVEVDLPSRGEEDEGYGVDVDDLDSDVDCMEGLNGEVVAVRTYALEEQATACQMILLLAEALQEHFLPYVEAVAGQLANLVNTSPHDDVRTFCMAAMPELVRSCGKAAILPGSELKGARVHQLLEFCLGRLLESLDKEEEVELLMTAAQACKRCVYYACVRWELHCDGMGDPAPPRPSACRLVLNDEQSRALARAVLGCLGKSLRRRALRRAEATASEDWDEEEEERAQAAGEEEMELHVNLAELVGFLFKTHGQAFLPAFKELLLPSILEMARRESLAEDRKVAVHVLDHALEFANPAAATLLPTLAPLLLEAATDSDPSVSLPAFFGIGVSATMYKEAFVPYGARSFTTLVNAITRPDAREESREMSTDNAVSALGSLLEALRDSLCAQGSEVGAEGVGRGWGLWLGYMPLGSDEEEAEKVAEQLCRLLTASPQEDLVTLVGGRLERLPLAIAALAEMAGNELVGPKGRCLIGQAVLSLHRGHNNRVPVESVAGALDGLGPEQRGWLDAAAAESQQI